LQALQDAKIRVAELQDDYDDLIARDHRERDIERPNDLRKYLESQRKQQLEKVEKLKKAGIYPRA